MKKFVLGLTICVVLVFFLFQNCGEIQVVSGDKPGVISAATTMVNKPSASPAQTPANVTNPNSLVKSTSQVVENDSLLRTFPTPNQIFQRSPANNAIISLTVEAADSALQKLVVTASKNNSVVFEQDIPASTLSGTGDGYSLKVLLLAGGWYQIRVAQVFADSEVDSLTPPFGVGDIYVIAGQSGAANHHQTRTQSKSNLVMMYNPADGTWAPCQDPMPYATVWSPLLGAGEVGQGTMWPHTGDLLATSLNVPIGFLNTAVAATGAGNWQPDSPPFTNSYNLQNQQTQTPVYQNFSSDVLRLKNESGG